MQVWVVTYHDCTGLCNICDGVWGVFSTWEKARDAIYVHLKNYDETVQDMDFNEFNLVYLWYTNKSIYKVESVTVDEI